MTDPMELAQWLEGEAKWHEDFVVGAGLDESPEAERYRAAAAALRAGAEREARLTRERDELTVRLARADEVSLQRAHALDEALAALRAVVSRNTEGSFCKAIDDARALLAKGEGVTDKGVQTL